MSVARKLFRFGLAIQLGLMAAPVSAQAPWPMPIEDAALAALIEEALSNNPDVAAARQAASAAGQRPAQVRALQNPMISVGYTNDGWSPSLGSMNDSNLAFMASQELPYPGKRRLRADIASREAEQAQQEAERVERGTAAAVKRAYYGLLLGRGLLEIIRDLEDNWKKIEGAARARYAVGQGAQQDVLRVQVEVTRVQQFQVEQEGEVAIRLAEINRLLGRAPNAPFETTARLALRPMRTDPDTVLEWTSAVSPETRATAIGAERAALEMSLAKKEFRPDFSVQAGYMNRGGLPPMWQARIGLSVPIYRKALSAGLAEAEARMRSSRSAIEAVRLRLRFRTQERLTQLKTTERVAALYADGIIPQGRMSVEAALAGYQTGKVPFIAVLEALTALYTDRTTHLRLLANHEQTLASLEDAGFDPIAGMGPGGGASQPMTDLGAPSAASIGMGSR